MVNLFQEALTAADKGRTTELDSLNINLENYIQQSKNMTKENDTLDGEIRLDFYRDANQYLFAYKLKACNAFLIFVLRCLIINVVCHKYI